MRTKLLGGAAALVFGASIVMATATPSSAREWRHHGFGWGPAAVAGGLIGGTVAAATSPFWGPGYYGYGPDYAYDPAYPDAYGPYAYEPGPAIAVEPGVVVAQGMTGNDTAYCEAHFKSYDPSSGTYLGYDGIRHSCP